MDSPPASARGLVSLAPVRGRFVANASGLFLYNNNSRTVARLRALDFWVNHRSSYGGYSYASYGYGRPYYGSYWGQGRRVARRVYRRHECW